MIIVYTLQVPPQLLPKPHSGQYHNFAALNDQTSNILECITYPPEYAQSDSGVSHPETSKYISECCDVGNILLLT
jgi:hypothetical protein